MQIKSSYKEHRLRTYPPLKCPMCEMGIPKVPKPPGKAYECEFNGERQFLWLSKETIEKIEKQLGSKLPDNAKFFVKK